ncbi:cytochrome c-type biogenesis protein CcmE [Marchantia polymorpha subsp. ruderalis]|uniref:Cytochrome c-type biogenesis protein CcmE n=2 Tax=Marchantia polymorpha TaxID=3197 RepID=A0AAF6BXY8_MARPO|nr:hypothetical protein MARPO_0003s0021 [Marchantia polymorpha]BBN16872.1 hypothetical protein Mp_7g10020 [Marchantia polymorpha subsp. ruderalis]|eukprot:PTQ49112.1 hypothetical protein MARPO_0003s0021 [Marchantia polymorpha]
MKASHVQRLATRILEFRGSISTLNCGFRAVEKSGTAVWYDVAESSKYGSPMWNRCFSSLLGRRAGVALGSRGIGCTVKSILEVPSSVQPFSRVHIRGLASGFRSSNGTLVDLGTRARQQQARRLWTIALTGSLVAGFIIIVLNTFQENMMFYITPSQALEKYYIDPSKNKFRLGGLVLEGSVHHFKSSADMEFVVTDLANEVLVRYRGALPDLFREGHSVVAEGFLRPIDNYPGRPDASNEVNEDLVERAKKAGCYFAAVDVLAKHDEKYMPKEVAAAIEKNKAAQDVLLPSPILATTAENASPIQPVIETPPTAGSKKKGVAQTPSKARQYEIRL